ncbi:hypothetical protein AWB69_03101 [Caballeronia udeis]|uniref:Uncharacterized protein n=1 Tax=Caballeronia udeis TaxID=1232866 RepID=A0A158GPZ1_9BURK|nr:hypothetical protein AWB69_03101 [Caballeronia udeis]
MQMLNQNKIGRKFLYKNKKLFINFQLFGIAHYIGLFSLYLVFCIFQTFSDDTNINVRTDSFRLRRIG